jgi:phosphoserine phosphatase
MDIRRSSKVGRFALLPLSALLALAVSFPQRSEARQATGPWMRQALRARLKQERFCRLDSATRQKQKQAKAPRGSLAQRQLASWVMRSVHPQACDALARLLASSRRGPATFDGDGTLWSGDVGEGFFAWMLKKRRYPAQRLPMLERAWSAYRAGRYDSEKMYELMVTGMAGMHESEVRQLATSYFDSVHMAQIYKPMATLVLALRETGFSPWVVSGSPHWVVAAGARHFGIPEDNVIGLSVRVGADGRLTDEVVRPVPWKKGKAARIMRDVGRPPLIAAGNSLGDIQMLSIAREVPLVVNPAPDFLRQARVNGWPVSRFGSADTMARWMSRAAGGSMSWLPSPALSSAASGSR